MAVAVVFFIITEDDRLLSIFKTQAHTHSKLICKYMHKIKIENTVPGTVQ